MHYLYIDKHHYGAPYIYIHPLRQYTVRHLVENKPPGTRQIIIFGSALKPYCREYSDVDVALVGDIQADADFNRMIAEGYELDIFVYRSLEELNEKAARSIQNTERTIIEEGLMVYGRK